MWDKSWRQQAWEEIDRPWDLIIIGGGITGAGILREATRIGLRALLIEQNDFAWGTSSRSSKLVHGGFRYLKNGQIRLTLESVHERERLIQQGRGLVNPLGFLMPCYRGDGMPPWLMGLGLGVYDLLALKWKHRYYDPYDMREFCPHLAPDGLKGGYRFFDAQTDDARLVLRVIQEAVADGAVAINYARAVRVLRSGVHQRVCGVAIEDRASDMHPALLHPPTTIREARASVVINATGAWADEMRQVIPANRRLRRLRGSHLVFSRERMPISRALSFWHPRDRRPVFAVPWEGVTILGTTDVDHNQPMDHEPYICPGEVEYLLESAAYIFPGLEISEEDVQATFAGIRPVVDTGKADPSKESREHVLWLEDGLLTVTGGKLTTFRQMAYQALRMACRTVRDCPHIDRRVRVLNSIKNEEPIPGELTASERLRLAGRYGSLANQMILTSDPQEMGPVGESLSKWSELRWAARREAVIHLDDLLLRRVRLGLQLPSGGLEHLERIREIVQPELGWDDRRWQAEAHHYAKLWSQCYHLPGKHAAQMPVRNQPIPNRPHTLLAI